MSNAFEVTTDDVLNVVHRMGKKIDGEKCHEIYEALDQDQVESEALSASTVLEAQTDAAYDEIERQIKSLNLLLLEKRLKGETENAPN